MTTQAAPTALFTDPIAVGNMLDILMNRAKDVQVDPLDITFTVHGKVDPKTNERAIYAIKFVRQNEVVTRMRYVPVGQPGAGTYTLAALATEARPNCTCPDFQGRSLDSQANDIWSGGICKHIVAVLETNPALIAQWLTFIDPNKRAVLETLQRRFYAF